MVTVVEETMAGAIRRVSVEEGVDPRGAVLVAFGGAGGLHAAALARRLDMQAAVVPRFAGVFSALGLLLSPPRVDVARSIGNLEELATVAADVAAIASHRLNEATGASGAVEQLVDVRYVGQSHELAVRYLRGDTVGVLAGRFHDVHYERNGFARRDDPVEVVTVRAAAIGVPTLRWQDIPGLDSATAVATTRRRLVTSAGETVEAEVIWRTGLSAGDQIVGPAVVEDAESTTYLDPSDRATVADNGALVIEW